MKTIIAVLSLMFAASPVVAESGWTCSVKSGAGKDSITKYDVIGQDLAESNFDRSLGRWQVEDTFSGSRRLSILQNDADALIAVQTETLNAVYARLILIQKHTKRFREVSTQLSSPESATQSIDGLCEPVDESKQ